MRDQSVELEAAACFLKKCLAAALICQSERSALLSE